MKEKLNDFLFPEPQKIQIFSDQFPIPSSFPVIFEDNSFRILEPHFSKHGFSPVNNSNEALLFIRKETFTRDESYRLQISPQQIILSASEPVGIFHGLQILCQIIDNQEFTQNLPCLEIEDFPTLERRGFMLDVSRCKVPTMESLYSLIDLLARLHINEFQLYIEHTFAFEEHQEVWKDASPFNADEIRLIDRYCQDRFIELVPNLNSFGHFERWLMHKNYKHLAECPDGFKRENPYIVRDHGTTLKPNQASLDFINSLYAEYLPNFSSNKFNVGMDEPWELGQGWSKNEVQSKGKDKVYLEHLEGIRKLVQSHGKEMQFWADVLLEEPKNAKLLPTSASPIIWGYEPSHPFAEQAETISACGLPYCLAPGTGTWRSFSGRWPNSRANIDAAISNVQRYKGEGILLTSWGDCGNHQPWATLYPPLLYGAAQAWNGKRINDTSLISGMDQLLFKNQINTASGALIELGKLDQIINSDIPNTSLCWHILFSPLPQKLVKHLKEKHEISQFEAGLTHLQSIRESISSCNKMDSTSLFAAEIALGIELSAHALQKGVSLLSGKPWTPMSHKDSLISKYKSLWLTRARSGGLSESMEILIEAITHK